jgi:hypothetical protein
MAAANAKYCKNGDDTFGHLFFPLLKNFHLTDVTASRSSLTCFLNFLQLNGQISFVFVLFSHRVLFNFIGPLARIIHHQSGFARAKDSWVLALVGLWLLMLL